MGLFCRLGKFLPISTYCSKRVQEWSWASWLAGYTVFTGNFSSGCQVASGHRAKMGCFLSYLFLLLVPITGNLKDMAQTATHISKKNVSAKKKDKNCFFFFYCFSITIWKGEYEVYLTFEILRTIMIGQKSTTNIIPKSKGVGLILENKLTNDVNN